MAYGPVNVPGVSEDELDAVNLAAEEAKSTAQEVSDKIGATGNTGGSATAGTVMGKLNKLISDLSTHTNKGYKVKSIQKGRVLYNKVYESELGGVTGVTGGIVDINISAVDSSKCVVLLYGPAFIAFKDGHAQNVYPSYQFDTGKLQLTTSVLSQAIPATSYASCYVTWHIIEFY